MIDRGKRNLLGVRVDVVDYEAAVCRIIAMAASRSGGSCTALAVHGVMTGVLNAEQRHRINAFDLVTPDGQPVRWGLNWLYGTQLRERVYGPTLMLELCQAAAGAELPIYLYGGRPDVVEELRERLSVRFPRLLVAGAEPSRFRQLSLQERTELIERVRASGAAMTFVGLGCPRQEVFAFENADGLSMPVIAVGAAFDYHAGVRREPPALVQRLGLQWVHRLAHDPARLWKRYFILGGPYVLLLILQRLGIWQPQPTGTAPSHEMSYG